MRDSYGLGTAPYEEDCAQVGSEGFYTRAKAECRAFINQMKRLFGDPPDGARFIIRSCPHDFGSYPDVEIVYDVDNPQAAEYAIRCENDGPRNWDAEARVELGLEVIHE